MRLGERADETEFQLKLRSIGKRYSHRARLKVHIEGHGSAGP